jgi:hypothetical protein
MTRATTILIASLLTYVGGTSVRAAGAPCTPPDPVAPFTHVRVADGPLAGVLQDGMRRSATLRRLVQRIEQFDAVVFVFAGSAVNPAVGHMSGAMSHEVVRAGQFRFIRITVLPRRGNRTLATMGHELQHAVEVLEAGVSGSMDVTDLYKRIGVLVRSGVYETDRARDAGDRVLSELARCTSASNE